MVNTNKILTVSYGTFSCTLEGFDDSFGTMKAIAEYFRDLAADDRYFGAEPPSPDAEMLARIAEREIARRVEAQIDNEKIHLRADPGAALPAAAPAEEKAPEVKAEAPPAEAAETRPAAISEESAPEIAAEPLPEEPLADDEEDIATDEPLDWPEDDEDTGEDAAAFFDTPAATASALPDAESVAAKLQRIRAVVSQEVQPEETPDHEEAPDYSEDEHAENFAGEFLADTHEDIEAALALDDAAEEARTDEEDDEDDGIAALLGRLTGEDEADEDETDAFDATAEEDEAFGEADEEETALPEEDVLEGDLLEADSAEAADAAEMEPEAAPAPIRARVIKMKRADFEAALASGALEEEGEDTNEAESGTASSLSDEDEADLLRELAAVEAEFSDADQPEEESPQPVEPAAEYYEDEDEDEPVDLAGFSTEDSFDEEDEDFGADSIFAEADDEEDHGTLEDEDDAIAESPFHRPDAESDMTRMFDMADAEMDEEAGKGRRNAIAHLRAAVAAAKAEEGAGGKLRTQQPDTEIYRDDLDSVVRPRRPETTRPRTRRPDAYRPAPLKLVAEQRVDLDEEGSTAPIRPRRVSTARAEARPEAMAGSEFAEYAESVGAGTLPELLEAAAAYLSFVEGREQFSRPQLMTQVRQIEQEEFTREDGLRSFGQLLREGKIEKLEGGRFRASESISYRPGARHAG